MVQPDDAKEFGKKPAAELGKAKGKVLVEQARGSGRGEKLVSRRGADGKREDVWVEPEAQVEPELSDVDYGRAVAMAIAGETGSTKALSKLLNGNKDAIVALAEKERVANPKQALAMVMEDVAAANKIYDEAIASSFDGSKFSKEILADAVRGLRDQKEHIFKEALRESANVRAKRKLENAVKAKILARASEVVAALKENVGERQPVAAEKPKAEPSREEKEKANEQLDLLKLEYIDELDESDGYGDLVYLLDERLREIELDADQAGNAEYQTARADYVLLKKRLDAALNRSADSARKLKADGVNPFTDQFEDRAARRELADTLLSEEKTRPFVPPFNLLTDEQCSLLREYAAVADGVDKGKTGDYSTIRARLSEAGIDPSDYVGFKIDDTKPVRDAVLRLLPDAASRRSETRRAPLASRELTEPQTEVIRTYANLLDDADDIEARLDVLVKENDAFGKNRETSGGTLDEWARRIDEEDALSAELTEAKNRLKIVAKSLEDVNISTNEPEFGTRESRAKLTAELPEYASGYRVANPDSIEILDDEIEPEERSQEYDIPVLQPTPMKREESAPVPEVAPLPVNQRPRRERSASPPVVKEAAEAEPVVPPAETKKPAQDKKPAKPQPKPGAMQRMASRVGKWFAMAGLALGLKADQGESPRELVERYAPSPDNASSYVEPAVDTSKATVAVDESGVEIEQNESLTKENTGAAKAKRTTKRGRGESAINARMQDILEEAGIETRAGYLKTRRENLGNLLKMMDEAGLPTKSEYQRMRLKERAETLEAVRARVAAMNEAVEWAKGQNPVLDAAKAQKTKGQIDELQKKIDRYNDFLDLIESIRSAK
jgi:hypothetical protein